MSSAPSIVLVDTEIAFEALVKCLNTQTMTQMKETTFGSRSVARNQWRDGRPEILYNIGLMLNDCSPRFACELKVHMKQIIDYKEARHVRYEEFSVLHL